MTHWKTPAVIKARDDANLAMDGGKKLKNSEPMLEGKSTSPYRTFTPT
jgi:hypothetical protein